MPTFDWTCPFCDRNATITGNSTHEDETYLTIDNSQGHRALLSKFVVCPNAKCKRFTLSVSLHVAKDDSRQNSSVGELIQTWTLIPSSPSKSFPSYIPKPILDDYSEASLIRELSPKASATLSRRCLQGCIRDFWQVKAGRLVDEISALKDKVDPLTWQAIEAVRKVGNIGAHMEADIDLIVNVEPQEAALLIGLIEVVLHDWYISREERKAHMESLVQLAADKDNGKSRIRQQPDKLKGIDNQ